MSFAFNLPLFSIVLSLICAVVSSLFNGKIARIISFVLYSFISISFIFILIAVLKNGGPYTYIMGHFPHPWGNEIRIGILEPLLSCIFSVILILSILGGQRHLSIDLASEKTQFYYVMTDLIQVSLLVLAYTNDIFTGYVFIEICTLASCGLLMIRQIGRTTLASVRYMIFSLIGSGLFLLGVVFLYNITGHLLMPNLNETVKLLVESGKYQIPFITAISLITIGLSIKSGLFPFHFWMPDTYGHSTPASSSILSGLVSKIYIFFLIKIIFNVFGTEIFYSSGLHNVLFLFGMLAMIFGSVGAIMENNIMRMLAYSSAAQIGYIYLGIGISPKLGIIAALFQIITHALTKPLLFISASALCDASNGSKKFRDLQGAGYRDKFAGVIFTIGSFSMIGIPITMGFMSKYLLANAAINSPNKMILALVVIAISTLLNTLYFARTIIRIYTKEEALVEYKNSNYVCLYASISIFALMNIIIGVYSEPLIKILEKGIEFLGKIG